MISVRVFECYEFAAVGTVSIRTYFTHIAIEYTGDTKACI
jgi:hypothetical protein